LSELTAFLVIEAFGWIQVLWRSGFQQSLGKPAYPKLLELGFMQDYMNKAGFVG